MLLMVGRRKSCVDKIMFNCVDGWVGLTNLALTFFRDFREETLSNTVECFCTELWSGRYWLPSVSKKRMRFVRLNICARFQKTARTKSLKKKDSIAIIATASVHLLRSLS